MRITLIDISLLKENPDNPRTITDAKFAKLVASVKKFPQMLEVRPIAFKSGFVVLGGNMRLRACKEAGFKQVPAIDCSGMTEEQQREFVIKDNVGFGDWDWGMIAADWPEAEEWGLEVPDMGESVESSRINTEQEKTFRHILITCPLNRMDEIEEKINELKQFDFLVIKETSNNNV